MSQRRLKNWLLGYQDYAAGTEVADLYNLWVGLSTIASAAQRKIYMDHDYFKTHLNMYVVLVGLSGDRKTTAIKKGKSILQGVSNYGHKIHFSTNATSAAALVQQFIKLSNEPHQSLTTFSAELGTLVRTNDTDIVGFLTDIYDCEPGWDKQTISRGLELIEQPWLNLIGATTPDWMTDNLDKFSVDGGFVRRILFISHNEERRLVAFPKMTDAQKKLKQDLTHDLAHIAGLEGKFDFEDDAAKETFRVWYEDPKRRAAERDSRLRSYYECKADHAKKVAMILSLAESDSLKLESHHITTALNLLAELETGMTKALSAVGKNPYNTDLDRIADQIASIGRISYKKLFSMNVYSLDKRQFDDNLEILSQLDRAKLHKGMVYSPAEWDLAQAAKAAEST